MSKILFIVESPGKIKKIQKILGSNYIVDASVGHVMDIPSNDMNIDVKNNFEPIYKIKPGYTKKVNTLKTLAKNAKFIILAMDEDREGEAIANGLIMALKLKKNTYHRVVFNEITKKAIMKGIENPRPLNYNLVYAQKARCVMDKYLGYSLSPLLWDAIMPKLSAGRVQSIIGRILVDKEKDINTFFENDRGSFFRTKGYFVVNKLNILDCILYDKLENNKTEYKGEVSKIEGETKIINFLKKCKKSKYTVTYIFDKISYRNPSPPFITSSLQQEASSKFGFSPKITMSIAQSLYEKGLITYMRTDSTMLADDAMKEIKKYIYDKFNKEYYREKQYKSKVKNAQEAHEAIRPTHIDKNEAGNTPQEKKLYSLIWKRTVASQMSSAKINNTFVQIDISKINDYYFESKFEEILFQGFLKIYNIDTPSDNTPSDNIDTPSDNIDTPSDNIDTPNNFKKINIKLGDKLLYDKIQTKQDYDKPPNRFTEASLIKYLEKNGIGRPSTYASMIDKVLQKKYAEKSNIKGVKKDSKILTLKYNKEIEEESKHILLGKENNKLKPTSLGIQVIDYLLERFESVMDYKFTANMEDKFDDISNGKKVWYKVLNKFNESFEPILLKEKEKNLVIKKDKKEGKWDDPNKRVLGIDKLTGLQVIATKGPHGPYVKLVGSTKSKSKSGCIEKPYTLKNINLEQALEILKYPYELGKYEKNKIVVKKGIHGLYLNWNKQNIPISNTINEKDLNEELACKLIRDKNKNVYQRLEGTNKEIYTILNGEFGPFVNIQKGKKKYNISLKLIVKDDLSTLNKLTVEEIEDIIKKNYNKPKYKSKYKATSS